MLFQDKLYEKLWVRIIYNYASAKKTLSTIKPRKFAKSFLCSFPGSRNYGICGKRAARNFKKIRYFFSEPSRHPRWSLL